MLDFVWTRLGGVFRIREVFFQPNFDNNWQTLTVFAWLTKENAARLCERLPYTKINKFYTLKSNLILPEETLWHAIGSKTRNQINRGKRMGVENKVFRGKAITSALINSYEKVYLQMFADKGINTHVVHQRLASIKAQDGLLLTIGYLDGEPLVYHTYLTDNNNAVLATSCSVKNCHVGCQHIGEINRFLHWQDMLYLKDIGVEKLDWGGVSPSSKLENINRFKRHFGGEEFSRYEVMVYSGWLGKMYYYLSRFKTRNA